MAVSLTWRVRPAEAEAGKRFEFEPNTPQIHLEATDCGALIGQASGNTQILHPKNTTSEGGLKGCLACGHLELFTQRDFPRALGITIVVLAAVLAPWTNYISLGVAALLDFGLFHMSRKVVVCYLCEAEHRGFSERPRHPAFDREIEERLLYGTKAVMGKPMRPGGTAGAPDPEH
ncbi:MAG: hypothetical protein ACI82F_001393 [Planctomycetota bacterium]